MDLNSAYEFKKGGRKVNQTITRAMLCEGAAEATGLDRRDVAVVCDGMFRLMREALMAGENVKLTGFGSLQVRSRAERVGRNPRTGTEHVISSRHTVVLTPSAQMREALDRA
jgi:integration host factor subunit alpha